MTDHEFFWVPEHPHLHLYRADKPKPFGKLGEQMRLTTSDIHAALQFHSKAACERWIKNNPHPVFVAREHCVVEA